MGEHVHGLDFPDHEAFVPENGRIPGQGGRVAGNIHHPLGTDFGNGVQHPLFTAGPGRIQHHHIGAAALADQFGHFFGRISAQELCISHLVVPGILPGIPDGRSHDFDSQGTLSFLGQEQGNGAGAAVGVDDLLLSCKGRVLEGCFIELFRLEGVHLEEGMGRNGKGEFSQPVMDYARPPDHFVFGAHDHIGMTGVQVLDQSGEAGDFLPEHGRQILQMGDLGFVGHQHGHYFPGTDSHPAHNVPDNAPPGIFFQSRDPEFFHPGPDHLDDFVVGLLLDQTVFHINDPVGALGVAANGQGVVPSLGSRYLHFIPVMPGVLRSQGFLDAEFGKMADPFHGVHHRLAFQGQLGRIGQVLELAAAALGIHRAGWGHPVWRRHQQFQQPGLAVAFLQQGHLGLDPLSRQGSRDEEGKAADFAHPFSGAAQTGDGQFDVLFDFEG